MQFAVILNPFLQGVVVFLFFKGMNLQDVFHKHLGIPLIGPSFCAISPSVLLYTTQKEEETGKQWHELQYNVNSLDCSVIPPTSKIEFTRRHDAKGMWKTSANGQELLFLFNRFGDVFVYDLESYELQWQLDFSCTRLGNGLKGQLRVAGITSDGRGGFLVLRYSRGLILQFTVDGKFQRVVWRKGEKGIDEDVLDARWNDATASLIVTHNAGMRERVLYFNVN